MADLTAAGRDEPCDVDIHVAALNLHVHWSRQHRRSSLARYIGDVFTLAGVIVTFALMNAYWVDILQPHNMPNVDLINTMLLWGSATQSCTGDVSHIRMWWSALVVAG